MGKNKTKHPTFSFIVFSILFTKRGETENKRLLGVVQPDQVHMLFQQQLSKIIDTFQFMLLTFSHP